MEGIPFIDFIERWGVSGVILGLFIWCVYQFFRKEGFLQTLVSRLVGENGLITQLVKRWIDLADSLDKMMGKTLDIQAGMKDNLEMLVCWHSDKRSTFATTFLYQAALRYCDLLDAVAREGGYDWHDHINAIREELKKVEKID